MSTTAPSATTADRGFTWSDDETLILLQLWSDTFLNSEIPNGNKKNFILYEKISAEMNSMGFVRTASQCKEKIKRMKREYTVTKQRNESGKNKKTMRFFEQFEKILHDIQNKNSLSAVVNSCSNADALEIRADDTDNNTIKRRLRNIAPKAENLNTRKRLIQPVEINKESSNPWTPDVVLIEDEPQPTLSEAHNSASSSAGNGEPTTKKRKLNSQILLFKSMMESLTSKFIKYQTDSDAKMLCKLEELENERTAMDERIQKMWLDFEERRTHDEREHELNVITTFQEIINESKITFSGSK